MGRDARRPQALDWLEARYWGAQDESFATVADPVAGAIEAAVAAYEGVVALSVSAKGPAAERPLRVQTLARFAEASHEALARVAVAVDASVVRSTVAPALVPALVKAASVATLFARASAAWGPFLTEAEARWPLLSAVLVAVLASTVSATDPLDPPDMAAARTIFLWAGRSGRPPWRGP